MGGPHLWDGLKSILTGVSVGRREWRRQRLAALFEEVEEKGVEDLQLTMDTVQ